MEIVPVTAQGMELDPLPLKIQGSETASLELPADSVGFFFSSSQPVVAGAISRIALDGGDGMEWSPVFTPAADEAAGRIAATN